MGVPVNDSGWRPGVLVFPDRPDVVRRYRENAGQLVADLPEPGTGDGDPLRAGPACGQRLVNGGLLPSAVSATAALRGHPQPAASDSAVPEMVGHDVSVCM